jgi:hypothetical protein
VWKVRLDADTENADWLCEKPKPVEKQDPEPGSDTEEEPE